MKYIFTATFVPNEDGTKYYCRVPDLPGCITTGSWIFQKTQPVLSSALIHSHTGRQPIPELSAKMSHFLHGWLPWQKSEV